MTIQPQRDPDRLHLRRYGNTATYFIIWRQRRIGQFNVLPILTKEGAVDPPILLEKPFSEQLQERIKDMVNALMGTNRDIVIKTPPPIDHPAIIKYFERQMSKW